jgi:hypothetical protein
MYHLIQFVADQWAEQERPPRRLMERVLFHRGTLRCAQVLPRVVESGNGPAETADLRLDDGTVVLGVPFTCFAFVD